jgi:hypothetical protein
MVVCNLVAATTSDTTAQRNNNNQRDVIVDVHSGDAVRRSHTVNPAALQNRNRLRSMEPQPQQ